MREIALGDVTITRVVEYYGSVELSPGDFFPDLPEQSWRDHEPWLVPDFVDPAANVCVCAIQTWVLRSGGKTILVDTGVGNHKQRPNAPVWHGLDTDFLGNLARAGVQPEDVDLVVNTHLHVDHVGWNTRLVDGKWVPTFPRARYLFGAAELDYWARSDDPLHAPAFADSVRPVIDAGLVEPVTADTSVAADVELRTTTGHTPGHMSVWIGDDCVITGDVLHHPIQCRHPEWTARGDAEPDVARATRRELLSVAARTNALVLGTHFAGTSAGRVVPTADGYRFAPENAS
jgi:glyoxylase-like metal-dependent hydrolase (beta-lactamase superfamily II)